MGRIFDVWFRPKGFETERLYELLGARVLKRYVPTGGDLAMRWARRRHPSFRLFDAASVDSLRRFERGTRAAEAIHVVSSIGFTALAIHRFSTGSLNGRGLTVAMAMILTFGLWPVVLQRYNRIRVRRTIRAVQRSPLRRRAPFSRSEGSADVAAR